MGPEPAAAAPRLPSPEVVARFEPLEVRVPDGPGELTVRARLLKPANLAPGRQYPLIVFLHGAGERGDDNVAQLLYLPEQLASDEGRRRFPCFLLAPQCPEQRKWVEVDWGMEDSAPQTAPTPAMQGVIRLVEQVVALPEVDRSRVVLTGLSMGGYGSWDLGARLPERWAAAAPICGGGDESTAPRLVGVPVWAVHGDQDRAVPVARSRRMIAALRAAGGEPKYTELAGVGHNSWNNAYSDEVGVVPWLLEQRRPAAVEAWNKAVAP